MTRELCDATPSDGRSGPIIDGVPRSTGVQPNHVRIGEDKGRGRSSLNNPAADGSLPSAQRVQCYGCAFKCGATAHEEPENRLRGALAALGGYPFACHESLGWTSGKDRYPDGIQSSLALLSYPKLRLAAIRAGADVENLRKQLEPVRSQMRMCGGWKAAIALLKRSGWFSSPRITHVRRLLAKDAAEALDRFTSEDHPERTGNELERIENTVSWFRQEAKESGVDIGWIFK